MVSGEQQSDSVIHIHVSTQVAVVVKNPPASAGNIRDTGSILGSERYSGEGNGNPPALQYSCLDYPHGQRSWVGYSPWDLRVGHD